MLDLLVILDRSGSMQTGKEDHEGGLRSFVEDQRKLSGDVRFTLVQFDTTNPCEVVYDRAKLEDVTNISLIPRGGTPLEDAIGQSLTHLSKYSPDEVICMIITDRPEHGIDGVDRGSREGPRQGAGRPRLDISFSWCQH